MDDDEQMSTASEVTPDDRTSNSTDSESCKEKKEQPKGLCERYKSSIRFCLGCLHNITLRAFYNILQTNTFIVLVYYREDSYNHLENTIPPQTTYAF